MSGDFQKQHAGSLDRIADEALQAITEELWQERGLYPNLANDEFSSVETLLEAVKYEMRAGRGFCNIAGARAWFKGLNDAVSKR